VVAGTCRGVGQTGRHPLPGMYSRLPGSDLQPLPAAKRAAVTAMRTKRRFMGLRIARIGRGLNRIDWRVGWAGLRCQFSRGQRPDAPRLVGRDSRRAGLEFEVFSFKFEAPDRP